MKGLLFLLLILQAFEKTVGNTAKSEVKFLQYFNNYGINLSKLDPTTNKWNKLNLATPFNPKRPKATNSIVPTPCN